MLTQQNQNQNQTELSSLLEEEKAPQLGATPPTNSVMNTKIRFFVAIDTYHMHSLMQLCFSMLFFTLAVQMQGYDIISFSFSMTSFIAILVCFTSLISEYLQWKENKSDSTPRKTAAYMLNGFAALCALIGWGLITMIACFDLYLFPITFSYCPFMLFDGVLGVPMVFFLGMSLQLTVSAFIMHSHGDWRQKLKITTPFILEMISISLLIVGEVQLSGLSNILPNAGWSLIILNDVISGAAFIAGVAAIHLAVKPLYYYFSAPNRERLPAISTTDDDGNNPVVLGSNTSSTSR